MSSKTRVRREKKIAKIKSIILHLGTQFARLQIFPLKEVDKAGLIFYIRLYNKFYKKFPIYNVAVMLKKVPKVHYGYVRHLTCRELYWFILRRQGSIPKRKIAKITRWFSKVSKRKPLIKGTDEV